MIGHRIKTLRLQAGYNQKQLANLINVSHQTVSKYEKEINMPDAQKLVDLSKVLNCTVDYLVGISDNPQKELTNKYVSANKYVAVEKETQPITDKTIETVIELLIEYKFDKTKLIEDIKAGKIKNIDLE